MTASKPRGSRSMNPAELKAKLEASDHFVSGLHRAVQKGLEIAAPVVGGFIAGPAGVFAGGIIGLGLHGADKLFGEEPSRSNGGPERKAHKPSGTAPI